MTECHSKEPSFKWPFGFFVCFWSGDREKSWIFMNRFWHESVAINKLERTVSSFDRVATISKWDICRLKSQREPV